MRFMLLWILLTLGSSVNAASERYALVIGNSGYRNLNPLSNPSSDARAIAEKLKKLGFQLIDGEGRNAEGPVLNLDMARFAYAIQLFGDRARGAEIAMVYYAGHGMQLDGRSYLLPVDTPLPDPKRDKRLEILRRFAQPLDGILMELDGRARLTIAVFDACREIPRLDRALRSLTRSGGPSNYRGLVQPRTQGRSRIVAYAGGFGQVVADGDAGHSPYTATLLQHLDAKGVPVEDVFQTVAWKFAQRFGGQNPEVLIQGVRPGHYYFFGPTEVQVHVPPVGQTNSVDAETSLWLTMQQCGTPACLSAYLQMHPQGRYAAAAKALLASQAPPDTTAGTETTRPTALPVAQNDGLTTMLSACRQHLDANRLTSGTGGTAHSCYLDVLRQDPGNADASAGLQAIVERYLGWARSSRQAGKFERAKDYLARAEKVLPGNPATARLRDRLASALAAENSRQRVDPERGGRLRVNVNLATDVQVRINGRSVGTAHRNKPFASGNLPLGTLRVGVEAHGYRTESRRIDLREDDWTRVMFYLVRDTSSAPAGRESGNDTQSRRRQPRIGAISSINDSWGYAVIALEGAHIVTKGQSIYTLSAANQRQYLEVSRIKGKRISAIPKASLSEFTVGDAVYAQ